jgi:hypothetical protein
MDIKREMILNAYKWRDNLKRKSDNELYAQMFIFIAYLSVFSNLKYMYDNYDKPFLINYSNMDLD